MKMLKSIQTQLLLRLKLFLKDKMTVLVFAISSLCFLFCMADLNRKAEEKASIPIGIVNEDANKAGRSMTAGTEEDSNAGVESSVSSQGLLERLRQQPALSVMTGSYEELEQVMIDGYIRCILVIREGYAENIRKGKVKKLISVYHEEGDNVASVITDIAAGEMMYDICLARGYLAYEELPAGEKEKYTREEYEAYAASLIGGADFDFAFEFRYVDTEGREKEKGTENSLFYRQAVAAAAAMLLALIQFTAMAGVQLEREQGITVRRKLLAMGRFSQMLGNLLAAGVLSMLASLIFAACVCMGTSRKEIFFSIFWTSVLFSVIMALVYYILAGLVKSLFAYQAAGAVFLLLTGVAGFCSMVEGILIGSFPAWFRLIPNCMYLKWFTDILS